MKLIHFHITLQPSTNVKVDKSCFILGLHHPVTVRNHNTLIQANPGTSGSSLHRPQVAGFRVQHTGFTRVLTWFLFSSVISSSGVIWSPPSGAFSRFSVQCPTLPLALELPSFRLSLLQSPMRRRLRDIVLQIWWEPGFVSLPDSS